MKNKIIGNPDIFAVEYRLSEKKSKICLGGCRIWLSGYFIGDIDSDIYLIGTSSSLSGMLNAKPFTGDLPALPKSSKELLELMTNEELPTIDDHWCLAIDGYDDFLKLFFICDASIIIYSSLVPSLDNSPEYMNYPRAPRCTTIPLPYFKKIVTAFEHEVDLLNSDVPFAL